MNYRKKPVVVQALQFRGDNAGDIIRMFSTPDRPIIYEDNVETGAKVLYIYTLEGVMRASFGDYIIRGVQGECYPCKPDIFEATYDPWPDDLLDLVASPAGRH